MDIQLIVAIIFFIFLGLFILKNRNKVKVQKILGPILYFVMYRTKLGLNAMDKGAKRFPRILSTLSIIGIWVGFAGMGLIAFELIKNIVKLLFGPKAAAQAVGLVLPFQVKGAFYVPFIYWIISIFILAVVHEFSHGIIARLHDIRVRSSGFAFLGLIIPVLPAAFVEPDEKQLRKKRVRDQLSVFAAGPFSNILLGFLVLGLLMWGIGPALAGVIQAEGVLVNGFTEGFPASQSGMGINELILNVDGKDTRAITNFSEYLDSKRPGDAITVTTNASEYSMVLAENPEKAGKAYMGVTIEQKTRIDPGFLEKYGNFAAQSIFWLVGLLYWVYLLNLGIGLFNLVPLGPVDGGRMLKIVLNKYLKEDTAQKIWKNVSIFFLTVILVNIFAGFIF